MSSFNPLLSSRRRPPLGLLTAFVMGLLTPGAHATEWAPSIGAPPRATAPLKLVPNEGLQRLHLPLAVMQASQSPVWSDVQIIDPQAQPVPFAWRPANTRSAPETAFPTLPVPRFAWPENSTATNTQEQPGSWQVQVNSQGAVVKIGPVNSGLTTPRSTSPNQPPHTWLLDLSSIPRDGRVVKALQLDWPAQPQQGVNTTVHVDGSDDAQHWTFITETPLLELPSAPLNNPQSPLAPPSSTSTSIITPSPVLPQVKHVDWPTGHGVPRYLRLRFDQALNLSQSALQWQHEQNKPALSHASVKFLPVAAEGATPAHWSLDLLGPVPLSELQLQLPLENAVLSLRLEQRNTPREPWRTVTQMVAWRLQREGRAQQSPPVQWSTSHHSAARYWRLVPDSRTAQLTATPLEATVGWIAPEMVFVAQGPGPLRLAVNAQPSSTPQALVWSTLLPVAGGMSPAEAFDRLPLAQAGELVTHGPSESNAFFSSEDRLRWLLWLALGMAVLGLGVLAWRLGKDMQPKAP